MSGLIALNQLLNKVVVGPLFPNIIALCANFSLKEYSTINARIVFQDISHCCMILLLILLISLTRRY